MNLEPAQYLVLAYALIILVGTVLLCLPQASSGAPLHWLDALFTATSATSITGLTVVNTGNDLSVFGQSVVMVLIQIGALGIMTMSTFFLLLLGKRIRLKDRIFLQQDLNQGLLSGLVRLVRHVLVLAIGIQIIAAALLYIALLPLYEPGTAVYFAVFHSISGFANAGFDLFGDSFVGISGNYPFMITIVVLFIVGGLGFSVVEDLRMYPKTRRLTLFSRVVLAMSGVLLLLGTLIVLALEWGNTTTLGAFSPIERVWHAFFLSATTRSAGFNTVPTGALAEATLFICTMLMIIGGSPGSTAAGIKTTTFAALLAGMRASITGKRDITLFDRRLPVELLHRALAITIIFAGLLVVGLFVLTLTEEISFLPLFFEVASAVGTVGLSTGVTPDLTPVGKFILISLMLIGRVGPMTFALAVGVREGHPEHYRLPEERLPLG